MLKRRPSLIICDVDGTLIDPSEAITPYFDELEGLIRDCHLRFTLASGRCYEHLTHYINKLAIREPVIINNGGGARKGSLPLWDEFFEGEAVKNAILCADKMDMAIFMCGGDTELAYRHNAYIQRDIDLFGRYNRFYIPLASEWASLRFEKVMITDPQKPGRVDVILQELLPFEDVLNIYRYDDRHLDIVKKGVSKGGGIARLVEHLGLSLSEVMVIGDSLNDVEMLQEAGIGVAVGNAKPQLKQVADYVCQASHTAGVIEAVQKFCMDTKEEAL